MLESYLPMLKHTITVLLFCFIIFSIRIFSLRYIKKNIVRSKQAVLLLFNNVMSLFFIILGVVTTLSNLGIKLDVLLGGVGIVSFIVGMALKDIISSLISGLMIMLNDDIKVGDILFFKEIKGRVTEVGISSIVLEDVSNRKKLHVIKNSVVTSECYSLIRGEADKKTKIASTS